MTLLPLSETPLGITREEIERLFLPFARSDDAEWRRRAAQRDGRGAGEGRLTRLVTFTLPADSGGRQSTSSP
jgi:hypothetical protein